MISNSISCSFSEVLVLKMTKQCCVDLVATMVSAYVKGIPPSKQPYKEKTASVLGT